ncbi:MAG: 4-alpha-glucanotransferase [Wenzhouxiangellaceae bacterium]|nr:4-alpha-glucanotransferase [Wenzhouxiangellaceae bacterium]
MQGDVQRDGPWSGRQAGVGLHISSLPGRWGIGEIGPEALAFVDRACRMGLRVWQFLPTGPTAYGDSPYQPLSTFAGNEMLISIDDLLDIGLLESDEVAPLAELSRTSVDYAGLIALKQAVLVRAAQRFERVADSALKAARDAFCERHETAWLRDYARYRVLKSRHGERPWPEWEARFAQREPAALARLDAEDGARLERIRTLQFLFHQQWARLRAHAADRGLRLFGDLPIYIALDSADAWAQREILWLDTDGGPQAVAGVPPDYFSADGQLWGNPLYDWDRLAATGYRWWAARLRAAMEQADLVRIDHFRAFQDYWAVPAAADTARAGRWIDGPGDALFEALRAELGTLPVVAENLGLITPAVEALRVRLGMPGMIVLQFGAADPDFSLDQVAEDCVCYTGTHDNDTTRGWFEGSPDDLRDADEIRRTRAAALAMTGGRPETIHLDLIAAAFATRARLAIAPMQDYLGLGSAARMNTPGVPAGNWRWRLDPAAITPELCDQIAEQVVAAGRV